MKHLPAILLFVLGLTTVAINAQVSVTTSGGGGKAVTEIIAAGSNAVVKGAPFSAEAVSESVQILADGNKISRSYTTKMFRDSEGRFRREGGGSGSGFAYSTSPAATPVAVGGFGGGGFQDAVSIFDPVANVRYILTPSSKTARRMNVAAGAAEGAVIVNGQALSPAVRMQVEKDAAQRSQVVVLPSLAITTTGGSGERGGANSRVESLGARDFDGVATEGTRTVTTIPAGAIGNERPIEMVYERWYSKELQLIVYSRHYDPRFGEQTYRLINLSRGEPDRSLFTVPADYKLVSESGYNVVRTLTTAKPQQQQQQQQQQ
jgi:hypothetical protein